MDRSTHVPASPAEEAVAAALAGVRPGLGSAYDAALPGARAAVLTRLWRALAFEPLPWVAGRERGSGALALRLAGGGRLEGPLADPYATGAQVGEVRLDGRPYRQAARLLTALRVAHGDGFAAELDDSTASLALSRAGQPGAGDTPARSTREWEQRVVDGHPYHPNCRSRPGFSVAEQLAYAPEHRPVVELGLVAVRPEECLVTDGWPAQLRADGRILIPVHPWQAAHVLKGEGLQRATVAAHPLMSLRTLAPVAGGAHVKTALSTRLTSSVRDISVYSVETAAAVSAFAEALAGRLDGRLHITRTLGAATAHSPDLAAVLREPPELYADAGAGERVVPVAALAGTDLARSAAWRAGFARLALAVCLRVLDLGVALEAHGQNLLVVLSADGAPLRLVYRDLADIRISPARLARHGLPVPPVSGRLVTDDVTVLRRKLFGSLVAGALGATAGSAAALAEDLGAAVAGLAPTADTEALLTGALPTKALTLMRLSPGVPGDQWTELPNPLDGGLLSRG
ncbi:MULTISPECIES: IucA/IucC family protein [unclassified Streptomyces]|uniref:IucA/IucC family protein n=1 Tax=unclassified Streptomyces TaxID=2593676 RepID=UPI00224F85B1|nr:MULTISPECIES: IucA/IucC family siderophore biosynthesis protein [unclassified Streptomyces]MCX4529781.1 IucA/IucC family siderophore biosynthesis protein [Streptomyces sp. NBC_01551]MCX4539647.1 IucA/IucC family siderophore biosynthesis protein [Streptomyces sp. NBC_01565]